MTKAIFNTICFIITMVVLSFQKCTPLIAADCADESHKINLAIMAGNKDEARRLILSASDINCKSKPRSVTPLLEAVYFQDEDVVKLIIEKGADVNISSSKYSLTPLHYSALSFNYKISKLLLDAGADVKVKENMLGNTPLQMTSGLIPAAYLLYDAHIAEDYGIDAVNKKKYTEEIRKTVELLLDNGADVNVVNHVSDTPLNSAILNIDYVNGKENIAIIELLISHGANINYCDFENGDSPINTAIRIHRIDVLAMLLDKHKNINKSASNCASKATLLHYAVKENIVDVVKLLIARKTSINATDDKGRTALHYVAFTDNAGIAKLLLKAGAKTNIKDKSGLTPLLLAKKQKSKKVVKLLSSYGKKH